MTAEGYAAALNSFVAQNHGAKNTDRIREGYRLSMIAVSYTHLPALPKEQRHMKYRDIRAVKILRSSSSVKLFFSGDHVTHPSGWQYAGAVYLFQRKKLNDVQKYAMDCLHTHHISFELSLIHIWIS